MTKERYSIWLIPPKDIAEQLLVTVTDLSKRYGGPIFEPHMTLLGDVELSKSKMLQKSKMLASIIKPFNVTSGELSFSTTYFQSVLLRIRSCSNLMQANIMGKEIFGVPNTVFMPHISLMYGDHPMTIREDALSRIATPHFSFSVDKIVVTPSTSDPNDWIHTAELPFI